MELFRPDKPIDTASEDKFQRSSFANRIAEMVSTNKFPQALVIGVYGKWGEGKSSIMNLIKSNIPEDIVVINFNPWLFSGEEQLIKSFLESIAHSLRKKLKTKKQRIAKTFSTYADSIGAVTDLVVPYGLGKVATDIGKKLSADFGEKAIENLKERIDNLIIEANTNFVIFIDDIDRLDITEAQAVFKLVKLLGSFPRTSYILSFDDSMIADALGPKYGNKSKQAGYEFLEKIIQVPLQIPKASEEALRTYTYDLLNNALRLLQIDLTSAESSLFVNKFESAFLPNLTNPRLSVRLVNAIGFSAPLLKGEVNISDLMIIESIKTFYPSLYHFIRNNPSYFVHTYSMNDALNITSQQKDNIKAKIKEQMEMYPVNQNKLQFMLIDLFPSLGVLFQNTHHSAESYQLWYREKRICSIFYFERYFSYVVKEGDISDIEFKKLIDALASSNLEDLIQLYETAIPKMNPDNFIFKLKQYIATFTEQEAITLAKLLASLGNIFPLSNSFTFFRGRSEVAYIIKVLLNKTARESRKATCEEILNKAQPSEFSVEIYRQFNTKETKLEEGLFLQKQELKTLAESLIERFLNESITSDMYHSLSDASLRCIFALFEETGKLGKAVEFIKSKWRQSEAEVLHIIKIFTPTHYSSLKPTLFKADFKEEDYIELSKFIDVELLYQASLNLFGEQHYLPNADWSNNELTDMALIAVFQRIHERSRTIDNVLSD